MSALAEAGGQLATYESDPAPLIRFREAMELARQDGLRFPQAWASALEELEQAGHGEWRYALRETVFEWQSAYDRRPSPLSETVLAAFGDDLEERDARPSIAPSERPPRSSRCRECGEWKGITSFSVTTGGGRQAVCQRCAQERAENIRSEE